MYLVLVYSPMSSFLTVSNLLASLLSSRFVEDDSVFDNSLSAFLRFVRIVEVVDDMIVGGITYKGRRWE